MLLCWAELSKSLIHLPADGWGWVPSLLFAWPEATQHWRLPGSLVRLMVNSGKVHAKEYFPELLLPVSLYAPPPHLYRRPSNTIREVWFSVLWGHCSFPWVLMCTLHCVCPSRVESLFPPVLSKSCSQILLAFKV